jgi:hypothetical protein
VTRDAAIRLGLRSVAIAVALAAAIDPAVTSDRRSSATLAVIPADSITDADLANRVAQSLDKNFSVDRSAGVGTTATIVVGNAIPHGAMSAPTFIVTPGKSRRRIELLSVNAPRATGLAAGMTARAIVHVMNGAGATMRATLRAGDVAVDQTSRVTNRADDTLSIPLTFVPSAVGAAALTVEVSDGNLGAAQDVVVDVSDRKAAVLFYDARPSWSATFVRHAAEADPRFAVVARTATSRNVASSIGAAPIRLSDLASISGFDAIVVGAPDALSADDVGGLEAFMRRRGGSVVIVEEQRANAPIDRLTGVSSWNIGTADQPSPVSMSGDSVAWKASQLLWPSSLPSGAEVLASISGRPVVWTRAVGAGQLVVNGVLDAWRFRDPEASGFARAWPRLIADAAVTSLPPLDAQLSSDVVSPGERVRVDAVLRDAALSSASPTASVGAAVDSIGAIGLWPAGLGGIEGSFRAPRRSGLYRVAVRANGITRDVPFRVGMRRGPNAPANILSAWATAHGGAVIAEDSLDRLPDVIRAKIGGIPHIDTWHPMRSIWWLLPFTIALAAEWWMRRRQGLR